MNDIYVRIKSKLRALVRSLCFGCSIKGFIVATLLFVCAKYIVLSAAPRSIWFHYDGISFYNQPVEGEWIEMISYSNWYIPVNVKWIDSLYCSAKDKDTFTFIDQNKPLKKNMHMEESPISPWLFIRAPKAGNKCYVESSVTIYLDFGITKTQVVKTDVIEVLPAE